MNILVVLIIHILNVIGLITVVGLTVYIPLVIILLNLHPFCCRNFQT